VEQGAADVVIRAATADDADVIGDLWLASFRVTYPFPPAYPDDDVRRWLREEIVPRPETFVAEDARGRIVGFMAMHGDDIDQLYVLPGHFGRGIGSRLLEVAKQRRPDGLFLYTFQVNDRARMFYERRGFRVVAYGMGEGNAEHQPDVRYEWRPG
jgi:ribosomal protein S18 acetylase RimI-like enzyme